jgi:hypothetical protein
LAIPQIDVLFFAVTKTNYEEKDDLIYWGKNERNTPNATAIRSGLRSVRIATTVKKNAYPISLKIYRYISRNYNTSQRPLTYRPPHPPTHPPHTAIFTRYGYSE